MKIKIRIKVVFNLIDDKNKYDVWIDVCVCMSMNEWVINMLSSLEKEKFSGTLQFFLIALTFR